MLRFWIIIPFVMGFIALEALYTDCPEVDGLLTSLSSVVFTVALVASMAAVMFVAVRVDQSVKRGPRGSDVQETFIP